MVDAEKIFVCTVVLLNSGIDPSEWKNCIFEKEEGNTPDTTVLTVRLRKHDDLEKPSIPDCKMHKRDATLTYNKGEQRGVTWENTMEWKPRDRAESSEAQSSSWTAAKDWSGWKAQGEYEDKSHKGGKHGKGKGKSRATSHDRSKSWEDKRGWQDKSSWKDDGHNDGKWHKDSHKDGKWKGDDGWSKSSSYW